VLNSAATLFSLDVYKQYLNPQASTKTVVRSGQICSFIVAVFAVVAAPNIFYERDRVFGFFQTLNGVYFIPLLAIIMIGMFNRYADEKSALTTLLAGLLLMVLGTFFTGEAVDTGTTGWLKDYFDSPFHYMGGVFVFLLVLQLVLSSGGLRRAEPYVQVDAELVDLTPWKPAPYVGAALITLVIGIYIYFAM